MIKEAWIFITELKYNAYRKEVTTCLEAWVYLELQNEITRHEIKTKLTTTFILVPSLLFIAPN